MRISEDHLRHWFTHGYVVVNDFLTPTELAAAQKELARTFPTVEEYQQNPDLYRTSYRGGHMKELPFLGDFLNQMAFHPEIVSFAERALETRKIALEQSLIWGKYPGVDDFDMPLHMDYRTTTLTYPRRDKPFEDVVFMLYYVDVDHQRGATVVVSNQDLDDELLVPDIRTRTSYPELYRREHRVDVRAGSMLIYNIATCHRSSGIAGAKPRFTHHVVYQTDEVPWQGYCVWANQGLSSELERLIEQLTPRQRELLGFPPPDHERWDENMLVGVAARYPNMDMDPYLAAQTLSDDAITRLRNKLHRVQVGWVGSD